MAKKKDKKSGGGTAVIITIIVLAVIVMSLFGYIVYKNIFASVKSDRYEDIDNYVFTQDEINGIKEVFKVDQVESVDVYTDSSDKLSRIIKIRVVLKEDIKFDKMKTMCNSAIEKVSEDNLLYYDLEVFISSKNTESTIYPQIGYKHRSKKTFSW